MEIFKELNKKGYKHYYDGTVEELDSMDKDNQHLHSEIMQVIMWLYEKHGIWVTTDIGKVLWFFRIRFIDDRKIEQLPDGIESTVTNLLFSNTKTFKCSTPIEAYEAAIKYVLTELI